MVHWLFSCQRASLLISGNPPRGGFHHLAELVHLEFQLPYGALQLLPCWAPRRR